MNADPRRYTVFGRPIAHSLSPRIHHAFARQFDIKLDFDTTDATPEAFAAAVQAFFAGGGAGANITVPHKRAAFELADTCTPAAERVGTANVLTPREGGRLEAHNTDGAALVRDLAEHHAMDLRGLEVLLVGAGGAAHGVAWSMLDAGVKHLSVVNRTPAHAADLCKRLGDPTRVRHLDWDDMDRLGNRDLVVNATSAGLHGQPLSLPLGLVGTHTLCYDISYGAAATAFLTWAHAARARYVCDGLGMLLETAADAFELWHGKRPDTEAVYEELRPSQPRYFSPDAVAL